MDIFEVVTQMRVVERTWQVVRNLLKGARHSMEKIASLAGVSVDFV